MKKKMNIKKNKLKYVEVYEEILKLIKDKNIKPEETIPSENELSRLFNVSRGTVRQAIALLKEDGILYNQQGVGNILLDPKKNQKTGMESINVPIFDFNNVEFTNVQFVTEFQPAGIKMKEFFERDENFIIMLINVKYYIKDQVAALLMYFINYDEVKEYDLNLKTKSELKEFIDKFIVRKIVKSDLNFQGFKARESIANKMNIHVGDYIIYFSEVMRKQDGKVAFYRRSYFNPNYFTFYMTRK